MTYKKTIGNHPVQGEKKKVYTCLIVCMIISHAPIDVIYGLSCRPSTLNLDAMLLASAASDSCKI